MGPKAYTRRNIGPAQEASLHCDVTKISLIGDRHENQDRVGYSKSEEAMLAVVADGMGGHANGARAAEIAIATLLERFRNSRHPIDNPLNFLEENVNYANDAVNALGENVPTELMPRTTVAVCLVQEGFAHWAHVGDSRIYHFRSGEVWDRTRDHSHVEILRQEGLITEDEMLTHPLRNYVESCLGGGSDLPELSISGHSELHEADILMLCTDGVWGVVDDEVIANRLFEDQPLEHSIRELCKHAVKQGAPNADNTTAFALKWLNEDE